MNKSRNTQADASIDPASLGIESLSARSVTLSALLGTHPPTLPARHLVALAELFGIRAGTTRTSLSRMVANGELQTTDGRYGLAGRLLERQREQDEGRVLPSATWDGSWITALASSDRRSMAERRAFRSSMVGSRMAELRPDIWLRPGNVASPPRSPDVLITRGPLECDDLDDLVARLWPLDEIEAHARRLVDALTEHRADIDTDNVALLPQTFLIAAAAVRFLRTEPQLPAALTPDSWTPPSLRPLYDEFDRAFQGQLQRFFASVQ